MQHVLHRLLFVSFIHLLWSALFSFKFALEHCLTISLLCITNNCILADKLNFPIMLNDLAHTHRGCECQRCDFRLKHHYICLWQMDFVLLAYLCFTLSFVLAWETGHKMLKRINPRIWPKHLEQNSTKSCPSVCTGVLGHLITVVKIWLLITSTTAICLWCNKWNNTVP